MPFIETVDDVVEQLADKLGVYGGHQDGETKICRVCFVCDMGERIRQAVRNELRTDASALAIYKGNSVEHWWAKAHAYSGIVYEVCQAFRELGYIGEFGNLETLPARLHDFVRVLKTSQATTT